MAVGPAGLGDRDSPTTTWTAAELSRGAGRDIAEAGRELGRYDGRAWLPSLGGLTTASVVATRDRAVPPRKQRELAELLGAPIFEAPIDHLGVSLQPARFRPALLAALDDVRRQLDAQPAAGAGAGGSAAASSAGR